MLTDDQIEELVVKDFEVILSQPIFTTMQLYGLKSISSQFGLPDERKKVFEKLFFEIDGSKDKQRQARTAQIEAEASQTSITHTSFIPFLPDELIETIMKSMSFYERPFYMSVSKQFAKVINQMEFQDEYIHFKNSFVILVNNIDWNQIKNYKNLKAILGTTLEQESENKNAIINRVYDHKIRDLVCSLFFIVWTISTIISAQYFELDPDENQGLISLIAMMMLLPNLAIIPVGQMLYSKFAPTPAQSALQSFSLFSKNNDVDNNSLPPGPLPAHSMELNYYT